MLPARQMPEEGGWDALSCWWAQGSWLEAVAAAIIRGSCCESLACTGGIGWGWLDALVLHPKQWHSHRHPGLLGGVARLPEEEKSLQLHVCVLPVTSVLPRALSKCEMANT